MAIIQNALFIKETNEILCSSHVHDYQERILKDGTLISVDGGDQYISRTIVDENLIIELILYDDSSIEEMIDKKVWGTYGKMGRDPLRFVLLKNCETDHLYNIIRVFRNQVTIQINIIYEILKIRYNDCIKYFAKRIK